MIEIISIDDHEMISLGLKSKTEPLLQDKGRTCTFYRVKNFRRTKKYDCYGRYQA